MWKNLTSYQRCQNRISTINLLIPVAFKQTPIKIQYLLEETESEKLNLGLFPVSVQIVIKTYGSSQVIIMYV